MECPQCEQDSGSSSSPVRVLLLTESFYPPMVGGQEKHAFALAAGLVARGMPVSVLTRQPEEAADDRAMVGGVRIERMSPRGQLKGKGWKAAAPIGWMLVHVFYRLLRDRRR